MGLLTRWMLGTPSVTAVMRNRPVLPLVVVVAFQAKLPSPNRPLGRFVAMVDQFAPLSGENSKFAVRIEVADGFAAVISIPDRTARFEDVRLINSSRSPLPWEAENTNDLAIALRTAPALAKMSKF